MVTGKRTWNRAGRYAATASTPKARARHGICASLRSREAQIVRLPVFSFAQRVQYAFLIGLFGASAAYFWVWWLQPAHRGNPILYWLMTGSVFYLSTVLPGMYAFFLGWMRKPRHVHAPRGYRTAIISLTVPGSESLAIVRKQLVAMTQVAYPHENWILVDKVHSPEVEALARSLGVRYFSRHDRATWGDLVEYWNQPEAPFKEKTKAGNVNAWLDAIDRMGVRYDLFTQLDIDHLPTPRYLDRVVGYFRAPKIAYVQAPSVYGNFQHWTSRGSAEQELVLHGPLQAGFFGFSGTPFIIGSHCTYRMSAIREIGGFQPTRAEDHLDTVILASKGYEGVFVPEVIAVGDGPETFETYIGQQFAWAYSMITVLFRFTPRLIRNYRPRQAVQFLFVQTWYTLWSVTMCMLFCLPSIALLGNITVSHTTFWDFVAHSSPQAFIAGIVWFWSKKWFQPREISLSWRGVVLHVARWPIVLSALVQVLFRVKKPYMITRKGVDRGTGRPFSLAPYVPYFLLILGSMAASWYYMARTRSSDAQGYLLFSLEGAAMVLAVYLVVLVCDLRALVAEGVGLIRGVLLRGRALLIFGLFATLLCGTGIASFPQIAEAVSLNDLRDARLLQTPPVIADQTIAVNTPEPPPARVASDQSDTPSNRSDVAEATASIEVPSIAAPTETVEIPSAATPTAPVEVSSVVTPTEVVDDPQATAMAAPAVRPPSLIERNQTIAVPAAPLPVVELPTDRLVFGVYDAQTHALDARPLDINHDFISWEKSGDISQFIVASRTMQRFPLVTIEPWTTASNDGHNILADTADGANDAVIRADAQAIKAQSPQVVMVRFAHEMELTENYPWAIANPSLYIEAYRHYVDLFRAEGVTNVLWMWSPAGNGDAPRYYPGDDYVDLVGLTILSNKAWDLSVGATDALSFDELFAVKYQTVAGFGRPIIIAEFGVASDSDNRQAAWLQDADASFAQYPLLRGVVYFNSMNAPNSWTGTAPDFRLPNTILWPENTVSTAEPRWRRPQ